MITINNYPTLNRVLLDANNTLIAITSSNGAGFYFRAKIYINDQLFDEQSWSRKNHFTAEKDLKKLYNAYYQTVFNAEAANGLSQQLHLVKKVSITIEERSIGSDALIQSQDLPVFYLMYSAKPVLFDDREKLQFLGIEPSVLQIPATGKLSIPFFVNSENEALLVELTDNFGNVIDSVAKVSFTDKRIYLYNFNFPTATLAANTLYFNLKITVGTTVVSKSIRLLSAPKFNPKEITFLNNFGYWCFAYLDGQLSIDDNFDIKTYEELDGGEKIYEINEKQNYTISTGSLLSSEKEIMKQICAALEAKIYLNSEYISMIGATKKINTYKDRNNLYSENLTFSVKKNNAVSNSFYALDDYDSDDYDSDDYTT